MEMWEFSYLHIFSKTPAAAHPFIKTTMYALVDWLNQSDKKGDINSQSLEDTQVGYISGGQIGTYASGILFSWRNNSS